MFISKQFTSNKVKKPSAPKAPKGSGQKFLKPLPSQEERDLMEAKAQMLKAKASRLSQGI